MKRRVIELAGGKDCCGSDNGEERQRFRSLSTCPVAEENKPGG